MDFRRITNLPPYVFTIINNLKIAERRAGSDVIDLGLRQPRHPVAEDRRGEARRGGAQRAQPPLLDEPRAPEAARGDRALYSASGASTSIPSSRSPTRSARRRGFSHLMWVLLDRGDAAIVPSPSYPIHIYGPLFAGADLRQVPMRHLADPRVQDFAGDFFDNLTTAWDIGWPKPRVLVMSFPHNPTGAVVDLPFMQRVVDFCREREMIVVPRLRVRRPRLRRLPAAEHPPGRGREGVRGRAVLDDEELLDGRVAVAFLSATRGRAGARQAEELPRLRHVPARADRRDR
jgi:alanine-synthesizing transaminase